MAKTTTRNTATGPVVFADQAFKSRTIVLEDGRGFPVVQARITAEDPLLIAHLDQHPEFERVTGE